LLTDTKNQWARDDPAFLVLLSFWLLSKYWYTNMHMGTQMLYT